MQDFEKLGTVAGASEHVGIGGLLGTMFGLGLAAAIFVDAPIVPMVLVPATMELFGDATVAWTGSAMFGALRPGSGPMLDHHRRRLLESHPCDLLLRQSGVVEQLEHELRW